MKRIFRHAVLVMLLALGTWTAMAAPIGQLSGGLMTSEDGTEPYFYGEIQVVDNLAVGLQYNPKVVTLSLWSGMDRGLYAQGSWSDFGLVKPDVAELGVWTDLNLSTDFNVVAWGGVKAVTGDNRLQLSLNAEADIPIHESISMLAGANLSLFGPGTSTRAWVGLATRF